MRCVLVLLSTVLVHNFLSNGVLSQGLAGRNFVYNNTYKYDTMINIIVNSTTEQILDFYEESNKSPFPTRVHISTNDSLDTEYPLFVTATQQRGVASWELPVAVAGAQYNDMARTLCPPDNGGNLTSQEPPLLQISTSNPTNVSVDVKLRRVQDFYAEVDKEISLQVTPSTPKYYYFSFGTEPWNYTGPQRHLLPRFNYTIPKSVILMIESDDDLCAVISIQNNSCPVFDNEKDMAYKGYRLTMTTKGGITLTQSMFPVGFYIVFIVKEGDTECTGTAPPPQAVAGRRVKGFRFRVVATISYTQYLYGALAMLALTALTALTALVVYIPTCYGGSTPVLEEEDGPPVASDEVPIINEDGEERVVSEYALVPALTVAGLSRAAHHAHARRSNRYFWSALTVAVVYALPVVQLLSTYQQMVFQTGDQDLCYYNFLCAHPLGLLSDSNHVLSNAGYVLLGLVFMLQTRARQTADRGREDVGIPQHHGLFYTLGLALIMEGLLSACYHLCPNKMNFQFDSSFMYVIAVVCVVKLYQNRHPDVNASAHATFMLLAAVIALGLFGIMYPSVYFWVFFTILHLAGCFVLTLKIYYVGQLKLDCSLPARAWRALRGGAWRRCPGYRARFVLLALANAANWALAGYGLYEHNKDFARHLLAILMGNTILYTMFYIIMKLIHRERIMVHTWIYFALAHAAWFLAFKLFLDSKTKWSQTPAHSRQHNAVCAALGFFDTHDLWHAASAAALYCSLNLLLTVDDALRDTPRHRIPAF